MDRGNLQDAFLCAVCCERVPVTVFITNGFQIKGLVQGYDPLVVILTAAGSQQMIYKHAISTIVPQTPVDWDERWATGMDGEA